MHQHGNEEGRRMVRPGREAGDETREKRQTEEERERRFRWKEGERR